MSWLTLIKYGAPALLVIGLVIAVDDNGYARGRDDANKVCTDTTAPAAAKLVQDQCDANTKRSKELNHELQDNFATVNARYYSLLKARCSKPLPSAAPGAAGGNDGTPSADESAWLLTLDQRYLNDKQAAQLVSCQDTIAVIYTANGRGDLLPASYRTKK